MTEEEAVNQCAETLSALGCVKSAEQLSLFANLLAIAISKGKSADQLNVIGNFYCCCWRTSFNNSCTKSIMRNKGR